MAERDRGRLPGPATSILENAVRFKTPFRTTPYYPATRSRPRPDWNKEKPALVGAVHNTEVFSCGDWKNGFSREAPEVRPGKPGSWPGLPVEAERRINYMIKLLVELPLIRQVHDHYRLAP